MKKQFKKMKNRQISERKNSINKQMNERINK